MSTAADILSSAPARFRPERAPASHKIFHFLITGDEVLNWSLELHNGQCKLHHELLGSPDCIVKTSAKTYIELETGQANPQLALMMGKIKVSNLSEMMQFAKCFRKFDPSYLHATGVTSFTVKKRQPRSGPLSGVRILDFTRLLPGPLATMMLGGMGAEIIKVEDPDAPDYVRTYEPMLGNNSAFYYALNADKRSLAVNYLKEEGRAIILQLLSSCDVLIEQFRPGVMKSFGLDYDTLQELYPRLIYVSLTGYGQEGAWAQAAGHDLNYIARAGLLGMIATVEQPVIPAVQLADVAGGSYTAMNAILAALFQRHQTGKGDFIDVAMADSVLPILALPFAQYQATGKLTAAHDFQLAGSLANYQVYRCADGRFLAIGALEPKFWRIICTQLNRLDWADAILEGPEKQEIIKNELAAILAKESLQHWLDVLGGADACVSAVQQLNEVASDPGFEQRGVFSNQTIHGQAFKTIQQPIRFKSTAREVQQIAPELGEDTAAILMELGYNEAQLLDLAKKRIVTYQS
ncbi:MAG: CoA transferase [Chitinophagales bacterium]